MHQNLRPVHTWCSRCYLRAALLAAARLSRNRSRETVVRRPAESRVTNDAGTVRTATRSRNPSKWMAADDARTARCAGRDTRMTGRGAPSTPRPTLGCSTTRTSTSPAAVGTTSDDRLHRQHRTAGTKASTHCGRAPSIRSTTAKRTTVRVTPAGGMQTRRIPARDSRDWKGWGRKTRPLRPRGSPKCPSLKYCVQARPAASGTFSSAGQHGQQARLYHSDLRGVGISGLITLAGREAGRLRPAIGTEPRNQTVRH